MGASISLSNTSTADTTTSLLHSEAQRQLDLLNVQLLLHSTQPLSSTDLRGLDLKSITTRIIPRLLIEPTLLRLEGDFVVVGDLHGILKGLQLIFERFGLPPEQKYIFLGDYVDRGDQGVETLTLLLLLKLLYPRHVFLLRGNHECRRVNKIYGFQEECQSRTSKKVFELFVKVFDSLPLAAIINDKLFCVHGGLSSELNSVEQLEEIIRPVEVPKEGLIHDILWTDPVTACNEDEDWSDSPRGPNHYFGEGAVKKFLEGNNLQWIGRSHSFVEDGVEWRFGDRVVTVFSVMKYCDIPSGNEPAVLRVTVEDCSANIKPTAIHYCRNDESEDAL